jgi:hypothetical protein
VCLRLVGRFSGKSSSAIPADSFARGERLLGRLQASALIANISTSSLSQRLLQAITHLQVLREAAKGLVEGGPPV